MRAPPVLPALLLLVCVGPARAQNVERGERSQADTALDAGLRVRVWTIENGHGLVGRLLRLTKRELDLRLSGAILGGLGGAIGGGAIGVALGPDCTAGEDLCGLGVFWSGMAGLAIELGAGVLLGWAIGRNVEEELWTPMPIEGVRVGIGATTRFGMAVSVAAPRR